MKRPTCYSANIHRPLWSDILQVHVEVEAELTLPVRLFDRFAGSNKLTVDAMRSNWFHVGAFL
jgi:hypothetical protein